MSWSHHAVLRSILTLFMTVVWLPAGDTINFVGPPLVGTGIPSDIGALELRIGRIGNGQGAVSVLVDTVDINNLAGVDFTPISATLTWADGDLAVKVVTIPILPSATWRIPRTFQARLSNPTGGAVLGQSSTGITIVDQGGNPAGTLTMVVADAVSSYSTVRSDVGAVPVSVTRSGQGQGALDATILFQDQGAVAGVDYLVPAGTALHWADGETGDKTVLVPILPHGTHLLQRSFGAYIDSGNMPPAVLGRNTSVLFTIIDPAPPAAGVLVIPSWLQAHKSNGSAVVQVARAAGSSGTVTVAYATSDASATSPTDYTATRGTLTWLDGDTSPRSITIPIINHGPSPWTTYLSLDFTQPTGGVFTPQYPSTTIGIVDDINPAGQIGISTDQVQVRNDQGTATITLLRLFGTQGVVSVDYTTVDVSAQAPNDYTTVSGTATWADGDGAPKVITVPIVNHPLVNGYIAFTMDLTNLTGGAVLYEGDWLINGFDVIIRDNRVNPAGQVDFAQSVMRVDDDAGRMLLPVVRSGGSAGQVVVAYDLRPETAQMSRDYLGVSGLLVWNDGETGVRNITVPVLPRSQPAGVRTFAAQILVSSGAADGGPFYRMSCAIGDHPSASLAGLRSSSGQRPVLNAAPATGPGSLSFTVDAIAVDELSGHALFTVARSGGHAGAIAVTCATLPGIPADVGYIPSMATLSWADGDQAPKTFSVPIIHDGLPGVDRTFQVTLSAPKGGALLDQTHGPPTATATIIESDIPPAGTLSFAAPSSVCSEGDGSVTLTVMRSGGSSGTVSVAVMTTPLTAGETIDFTPASTILTWPAGDAASRSFSIPILRNHQPTGDRQFTVALWMPTGGAQIDAAPVTVTIHDLDANPAGMLQLTAAMIPVVEDVGVVDIHVERSGGSAGAVTVDYTLSDGFAIFGTDYQAVSHGTLAWPAGDAADRLIPIAVVDRGATGKARDLKVTLTRPTGGVTTGRMLAAMTITDPAPAIITASPASGSTAGGTSITISGTNLLGVTSVMIGGTAAAGITSSTATSVTITVPAHAAGAVDIIVTTPAGAGTGIGVFTYAAPDAGTAPTSDGGSGGGKCGLGGGLAALACIMLTTMAWCRHRRTDGA